MRQQNDERELLRSYLLGSLDDARLEELELRLLADAEFRENLRAAQDELIDDYAFNILSGNERESFEQHFLSAPGRAEQLSFARAMKDYLEKESTRGEPKTQDKASWLHTLLQPLAGRKITAALALAACLILVGIISLLVWREVHRRQDNQAQSARAMIEREVLLWTRQPPVTSHSRFANLTLTPSVRRDSSGVRRIIFTDDTLAAQLRLELTDRSLESYQATLLTNEEVVVFTIGDLYPEDDNGDRVLVLRIPARFLQTGDYQLKLRAINRDDKPIEVGSYPFQVIHRTASR